MDKKTLYILNLDLPKLPRKIAFNNPKRFRISLEILEFFNIDSLNFYSKFCDQRRSV